MLAIFIPDKILGIHSIWLLTFVMLLLGGGILIIASKLLKGRDPWYEIVKDVAIGLLVAAFVTITYDSILDFRNMSHLVGVAIGDRIPEDVWDTAKSEIFDRDIIRENAELRFRVEHDNALPEGQALLKLEVRYDLYWLKPKSSGIKFMQELEHFHIRNEEKDLPRFDSVSVGTKVYSRDELRSMMCGGLLILKDEVQLNPWPKVGDDGNSAERRGTRVVTERTEIINIPGSYHVVLPELTKRVSIHIETPPDVQHELKKWFERRKEDFKPLGKYNDFNGIALPGQAISFQFKKRSTTPTATPTPRGGETIPCPSPSPAEKVN